MSHDEFENLAALHAAGAATEEESDALRKHIVSCPSCAATARQYEEAAALMAQSLDPVAPPAEVRDQILSAVGSVEETVEREVELAETTVVGWRSRRMKPIWWLATVAAFFLALWGWNELRIRTVRAQMEEIQASKNALEEANRRLQRRNETLADTVGVLTAPRTRMIALTGQQVAPSATARVFLDPEGRRALVFFHDLPPCPADKTYELWVIRADEGAPRPAGTFGVDERGDGQLSLENLPVGKELKGLAVTLEPRGGAPAPTGATYLAGSSS